MKANPNPDVLFAAMKEYLESLGWKILVAGPVIVERETSGRSNNYRFVVNFLGKGPEARTEGDKS